MGKKPVVFVLMPFDAAFNDVYLLAIKQACLDAGAHAQRVDEQIYQETILQRVYDEIRSADLIVAEMTGRNPNVFYEVGYAHALGKKVILITSEVEDIPFDLTYYPHIVYRGRMAVLREELARRITFLAAQRKAERPRKRKSTRGAPGPSILNGESSEGIDHTPAKASVAVALTSNVSERASDFRDVVPEVALTDELSRISFRVQQLQALQLPKDDAEIFKFRTVCIRIDVELRRLEERAVRLDDAQSAERITELREQVAERLNAARVSSEPGTTGGI
ncbi:MAG TPA: nucleoside 2-deoxyribosyltransferase [Thermoanaerobaculia bacterium]|nr:nucleoside 2-deoxyribosyltransferase [Thermoanaerobaculia bacterium]